MKFDWGHVAGTRERARAGLLNSTAMRCLNAFRKDEEGASGLLSFYVTIIILMMAGLGVDTMRQEMHRTHIQATLDAAVLAGAGAPTEATAEEIATIVEDYFDKNGMGEYLADIDLEGDSPDIVTSLNATRVYAEAQVDLDTYLMKLTGVDELRAAGAAEAVVATPKLEVAMVLDVSGSMGGQKLIDLKGAAKTFTTTILNQADPGDAIISVVPFSWNVTPTAEMFDALTVNQTHDYATCLRFDDTDFKDAAIDPDVSVNQQIFTSHKDNGFNNLNDWWRSCYNDENAEILPFSMSETDLHAKIQSLTADGNTSAHLGMKWGAAMLDDEFQDVADALRTADTPIIDASLTNIPAVYGEAETLKVIVLMADGANTESYYFNDASPYRGAGSPLYEVEWQDMVFDYAWRINKNGKLRTSNDQSKCSKKAWTCVYTASGDAYSAFYLYDSYNDRYLDIEASDNLPNYDSGLRNKSKYVWISAEDFDDFEDLDGSGGGQAFVSAEAQSWEVMWGMVSPDMLGDTINDWGPYNDYEFSETDWGSTKDVMMQDICTATKDENVVVYTIGYGITAGSNAETQLKNCASSFNHYYAATGSSIGSAFNSIASNVKNLRLTQ